MTELSKDPTWSWPECRLIECKQLAASPRPCDMPAYPLPENFCNWKHAARWIQTEYLEIVREEQKKGLWLK